MKYLITCVVLTSSFSACALTNRIETEESRRHHIQAPRKDISVKSSQKWTRSKARLQLIRGAENSSPHWIFVPGGPGLGSEYLSSLTEHLKLPGSLWHFDFPGDGSNRIKRTRISTRLWKQALLEAVELLDHPILVTHSFGGMFALSVPELQDKIRALVLIDSAPNHNWIKLIGDYAAKHPIPELDQIKRAYLRNPSDEALKKFTMVAAPYSFPDSTVNESLALFQNLPFNHEAYDWAQTYFHPKFESNWDLDHLPVMILGGELDILTPLKLFVDHPKFQKENIHIIELKGAGHFPWIENRNAVIEAFQKFSKRLKQQRFIQLNS